CVLKEPQKYERIAVHLPVALVGGRLGRAARLCPSPYLRAVGLPRGLTVGSPEDVCRLLANLQAKMFLRKIVVPERPALMPVRCMSEWCSLYFIRFYTQ